MQVKSEIIKKLQICQQNLRALRAKRQTSNEQSRYLTGRAIEFQELFAEALSSKYRRTGIFDQHSTLRLATAAVNRSDRMSEVIAVKGHTFHFESDSIESTTNGQDLAFDEEPPEPPDITTMEFNDHSTVGTIEDRLLPDHPELEDLVQPPKVLPEPRSGSIHSWLQEVYSGARGLELGTLNSSLLAVTIKRQPVKWQDLALGYIADIVTMAHTFVNDLLRVVCPVERVHVGIMSFLIDRLVEKYKLTVSHVSFFLEVELDGTPGTLNHYFNDNLEKW